MTQLDFRRRFLLFNDGVCIGIFEKNDVEGSRRSHKLSMIFSSKGDVVYVSKYGAEAERHMTRFVPSDIVEEVKELLLFRNAHTEKPFLCERFNGGSRDLSVSQRFHCEPISYCSDTSFGDMSSASILFDADEEGRVEVYRCPLGRRLRVTSEEMYYPDKFLGNGITKSNSLHSVLTRDVVREFPIAFAPLPLLQIAKGLHNAKPHSSMFSNITNGSHTFEIFDELRGEMSLLHDLEYYPSVSKRVAIMEQVDHVTYTLNGPEPTLNGPTRDLNKEDLVVEAWFLGSHKVLALKGEYFMLLTYEGGVARSDEVHISLIDLSDEPATSSKDEPKPVFIDQMRAFRSHLVRLVAYRDYLEVNRANFRRIYLSGYNVKEGESLLQSETRSKETRFHPTRGEDIILNTREAKFVALTEIIADPEALPILSEQGKTLISRIYGTFLDHTIMNLDLSSKMVSILTPERDFVQYHLTDCLSYDDQVAGDLLTAKYTQSEVREQGPSPVQVRHVRSLVAFYRWARAPVNNRNDVIDEGRRVSQVAQTAALKSHRHVLLHMMRQGKIKHPTAVSSTELLQSSLNTSGRDRCTGFTPYPYIGLVREFDEANDQTKFNRTLAPKSVYSAVVNDPAMCTHSHLHYVNMRKVAKNALNQTSVFLAKEYELQRAAHINSMR